MIAEANRRALERRGDIIAKALTVANDTHREKRLEGMLCIICSTENYLSGQGFTRWRCFHCDREDMHHNTHVPRLCIECAKKLALCRHCLADINLEIRYRVSISKTNAKRKLRLKRW